uniref:C-type lectin domain-containing protein n=1 Tax=Petromyzon marinus TaxID=7757 RepID=S4RWP2_PETMA
FSRPLRQGMESGWLLLLLPLGLCSTESPSRSSSSSSSACLSSFMLPGPNGDQGEKGEKGEQGLNGEQGAVGERGNRGPKSEKGSKGIMGPYGKIGAVGEKAGVKGELGGEGPIGPVGDPGSHCECGHLRRTVGELDIVISQLKNEVQLMKNDILVGVSELGQKSYIVVKEGKSHADAASDCQHRGGTLAMPKDKATNDMLASFLSHRGVGAAYIGVRDARNAPDAGEGPPLAPRRFAYVDGGALAGGLARWRTGEPNDSGGAEGCVELTAAAGEWNDVDCAAPAYFVCEFERAAA